MPARGIPNFHDEYTWDGYKRVAIVAVCTSIADIIDDFLELWRRNRGGLIDLIDALLADIENAQLGTAIQEFLGSLTHADWQHHWDALDQAPAEMKRLILDCVRDAAVNELDLYIDMAVDFTGAYGVEVTAGFDGDGSWRYLNLVHPAPTAN
jgi:hypothetical protein